MFRAGAASPGHPGAMGDAISSCYLPAEPGSEPQATSLLPAAFPGPAGCHGAHRPRAHRWAAAEPLPAGQKQPHGDNFLHEQRGRAKHWPVRTPGAPAGRGGRAWVHLCG